eukprot:1556577-Alexandrium_andersonii.AAC.1
MAKWSKAEVSECLAYLLHQETHTALPGNTMNKLRPDVLARAGSLGSSRLDSLVFTRDNKVDWNKCGVYLVIAGDEFVKSHLKHNTTGVTAEMPKELLGKS